MENCYFTVEEKLFKKAPLYEINMWETLCGDKAIIDCMDGLTLRELIDLRDILSDFIANKTINALEEN